MGLLRQAYETYTAMESQCMGIYKDGQKEPLCPPSHIITAAQIEITLDRTGNFVCASAVDKSEQRQLFQLQRILPDVPAHPVPIHYATNLVIWADTMIPNMNCI